MITTLALDDDVATALERVRRARDASLKDVVNDALHRRLNDMRARPKRHDPSERRVWSLDKSGNKVIIGAI